MPYLGSTPNASFSSRTKQDFTANGSTTAFTLSSAVASPNDIEVFVGNVRQEPTDAYTVNGTTLTMSEAPATGLNFYVVFKGVEENSVVPADGSISDAKIVGMAASKLTGTITDAKLASGITASKLTGALPALNGSSLTNLPQGQVVTSRLAPVITVTANHSGHNSWANIGGVSVTPTNSSSKLLVHWTCGFTKSTSPVGLDFALSINGSRVTDAVGGASSSSMEYEGHRRDVVSSGYFQTGGCFVYQCVSTTAVTVGAAFRIYDESSSYTVGVAHTAYPLRLVIEEIL